MNFFTISKHNYRKCLIYFLVYFLIIFLNHKAFNDLLCGIIATISFFTITISFFVKSKLLIIFEIIEQIALSLIIIMLIFNSYTLSSINLFSLSPRYNPIFFVIILLILISFIKKTISHFIFMTKVKDAFKKK